MSSANQHPAVLAAARHAPKPDHWDLPRDLARYYAALALAHLTAATDPDWPASSGPEGHWPWEMGALAAAVVVGLTTDHPASARTLADFADPARGGDRMIWWLTDTLRGLGLDPVLISVTCAAVANGGHTDV